MFEQSLIESMGDRGRRKRWFAVPLSIVIHSLVVGIIIAGSYWFIAEAVPPPTIPIRLLAPPPPPPPPPPPAKKKAVEQPKPEPKTEQPKPVVQPIEIPQELPKPEEIPGGDSGMEAGVEGGVEGGVPGGVVGGVPGGVIGGVLGSDLLGPFVAGEDGVSLPELIPETKVQPVYPEAARKSKVEGSVILQAVIRKDGTVGDIVVLRSPGKNMGFEEAAIEAVRQWRYKPATKNGKAVDVYFTVEITFYLL